MLLMLAGCGGGGGGSSTPSGAFTISSNSVSFAARQNGATPASQSLTINITGPNATYAGAAYPAGQTPPSWLSFSMNGSGTTYNLVLSITSTALSPGQYTTTFGVGTADSAGKVLQSQSVTVTYTVTGVVAITTAPYTSTFTYGGSRTSDAVSLAVTAPTLQWSATSDSPWLQVPSGTQTGNGSVQVTVAAASLIPGSYQGHVIVTDKADPTDTASLSFSIAVQAPTLTVPQATVVLGGADGLSTTTAQSITFSLSTDTASHPFAITLSTAGGGNWLAASATTGSVNASGTTIQISGNRAGILGGTYSGQVQIAATVGTLALSGVVPVTFNVEANRIVVGSAGVGFLSSSTQSVLTRNVTVFSALGRTDVPWQATSDQPWLAVTGSGVTGGAITLTATPTGLPLDSTQFANVTVTSSDATVENREAIRVGLYVSSTAPATISQSVSAQFLAASPVEPLVFLNHAGTDVTAYNVYTGALARTLAGVVAQAGPMVLSADGKLLYVYDQTNLAVLELDATSGALTHTYSSAGTNGAALGYVRPNGFSMLITPSSRAYDVTSYKEYDSPQLGGLTSAVSLAASPDSSKIVTDSGNVLSILRSALGGGQLNVTSLFGTGTAQGASGQACISADGQTVYTASGAPYDFPGTSMSTHLPVQTLPGQPYPNAMVCLWNGVVIGGTNGYYSPTDVFVYNGATGTQLGVLDSSTLTGGYRSLLPRGLAVSADGTQLVTLVLQGSVPVGNPGNEVRFQPLPPLH
jgi:hypothetical protein